MPPRATKEVPRFHLNEVDAPVPASVQKQLVTILHQRELLESAMAETDANVYELETGYLGLCVELGGSLFDGFGLERSSLVHAGSGGSGSPRSGTRAGLTPSSPAGAMDVSRAFPSSPVMDDEVLGAMTGSGVSGSSTTLGGLASNILSSNLAFRARVHAFSPAERVFSSSSVGAVGRVERLKAVGRAGGKHAGSPVLSSSLTSWTAGGDVGASSTHAGGRGKSLWTSAGRRRSARAGGAHSGGGGADDEDEEAKAHAVGAVLYTTAGQRKRARQTSDEDEDDDSNGGGKRQRSGRRGGAGRPS